MLNTNQYFTLHFFLSPLSTKMTFRVHLCGPKTRSRLHTRQACKGRFASCSIPTPVFFFFHLTTFLYLLLHMFRTEGKYGERNCQRARNRGVLRQAKCFLSNIQAGVEQAGCGGAAPGPELRGDSSWSPRPARRLLISACLHILSRAVFKDSSTHPWQIILNGKYYSTFSVEKSLVVEIRNY